MPARLDDRVTAAAEAFLRASSSVTPVPPARRESGPSDVIVFDVMREALTNVRADYIALQRRAREDELPGLIEQEMTLVREVDAIDGRDRDAQAAMTEKLQERHVQLRERIDAA